MRTRHQQPAIRLWAARARGAVMRRRSLIAALGVAGLVAGAAVADAAVSLGGKWLQSDGTIVTLAQLGDTVTIPRAGPSVSGTVSSPGAFTVSGASGPGCTESGTLQLFAGEEVIDGVLTELCGPPTVSTTNRRLTLTRCSCDDGNDGGGDGCDATCRVEPCFTCTGDPSVCTPSADGAACDDRRTCTSGETCNAGVCGGGAVVPTCVDLSGPWRYRETVFAMTIDRKSVV